MLPRNGSAVAPSVPQAADPCASEGNGTTIRQALDGLRDEIVGGLLYSHTRVNANTSRVLEVASFLYALIELLETQGLITIEDLDARKDTVAARVKKRYLTKGMGVNLQEPEQDKYTLEGGTEEIDCENRVHLCKAACCRLWFPLSMQDVQEGIVRWNLRDPYIIALDGEGYCHHLKRETCQCAVYPHRPVPCRAFDCRKDTRIWLDFDTRVINPDLDAIFHEGDVGHDGASGVSDTKEGPRR